MNIILIAFLGCAVVVGLHVAASDDSVGANPAAFDVPAVHSAGVHAGMMAVITGTTASMVHIPQSDAREAVSAEELRASEISDQGTADVQLLGTRVLWTLAILLFTYLLAGIGSRFLLRQDTRRGRPARLLPLLQSGLWIAAAFVILAFVFDAASITILVLTSILLLLIGVTSLEVIRSVIGGIILSFNPLFRIGDRVTIDGIYGEVVAIELRYTRILTPDRRHVSIPNAIVVQGPVSNASRGARQLPVTVDLYLTDGFDVRRAREIAREAAVNSRFVYLDEAVTVHVREVLTAVPYTQLQVMAHVIDGRFELDFISDVTEAAKSAFESEGLPGMAHLPHPSQDLW